MSSVFEEVLKGVFSIAGGGAGATLGIQPEFERRW
jgi:hypothetical protein